MAFTTTELQANTWTLVANNATTITFQNSSQWPIYVNVTANTTEPAETVGIIYKPWDGELKKTVNGLAVANGAFVWARSMSKAGKIVVDSDGSQFYYEQIQTDEWFQVI